MIHPYHPSYKGKFMPRHQPILQMSVDVLGVGAVDFLKDETEESHELTKPSEKRLLLMGYDVF